MTGYIRNPEKLAEKLERRTKLDAVSAVMVDKFPAELQAKIEDAQAAALSVEQTKKR